MIRTVAIGVLIALLASGCSSSGRFEQPVEPPAIDLEVIDRTITYAIDPGLDQLQVSFECDALSAVTYDYGDVVGRYARDVFAQRFTTALEVGPDEAEVVLVPVLARLRWVSKKQMITFRTTYILTLGMVLVWQDGRQERVAAAGQITDDNFDACGAAAGMIDALSPDLLRHFGHALAADLE